MGWSSYPPEHKRSFFRAVGAYAIVVALAAGWVWFRADKAAESWRQRVPHAVANVNTVYASQQLTQTNAFSDDNTILAPGQGEGYVSIILTDAGISEAATERALDDLPPHVAMAFSPYSPKVDDWIRRATQARRESLILIPMEPATFPKDDPGPQALLSRLSEKDNRARLDWVMEKSAGAMGAMNFMGSEFLADDRNLSPVFSELHNKNALFVEDAGSRAAEAAKNSGVPYLSADLRIDAVASELAIKKQLLNLEDLARKRGYAVGVAQPYPITFDILKGWSESLDRRGIKLVPLTTILKTKVQHDKAAPPEEQQQPQQAPQQQP